MQKCSQLAILEQDKFQEDARPMRAATVKAQQRVSEWISELTMYD